MGCKGIKWFRIGKGRSNDTTDNVKSLKISEIRNVWLCQLFLTKVIGQPERNRTGIEAKCAG